MAMILVNTPDKSYHRKLKELAEWYYKDNPDNKTPEEQVRFGKQRTISIIIRELIDKEYKRYTDALTDTETNA